MKILVVIDMQNDFNYTYGKRYFGMLHKTDLHPDI